MTKQLNEKTEKKVTKKYSFEETKKIILGALLMRGGPQVMARLIHYMPERVQHRERWVGALMKAAVPLKLIDGADDPVSGRHLAARYRELVPSADVTLLEGVGHYPQVEAPQPVLDAYLRFRGLEPRAELTRAALRRPRHLPHSHV